MPADNNIDDDKKAPAAKAKPKALVKKAATTETFGISYLGEQLGKKPNIIRIMLRKAKIKKPGKRYAWTKKTDADAVVAKLKKAA